MRTQSSHRGIERRQEGQSPRRGHDDGNRFQSPRDVRDYVADLEDTEAAMG